MSDFENDFLDRTFETPAFDGVPIPLAKCAPLVDGNGTVNTTKTPKSCETRNLKSFKIEKKKAKGS